MKPAGRIFQDDTFDLEGVAGECLEELIGVVDESNNPILIFIKLSKNTWQQFFLDAGLAFWESWGEMELEEGDITSDYGALHKLKGRKIKEIRCRESKVSISFMCGAEIALKFQNSDIDSMSEVIFTEKS